MEDSDLLSGEFIEEDFSGREESEIEIQEYTSKEVFIETENNANIINSETYVQGNHRLDLIPNSYITNSKTSIRCCQIHGRPVNVNIADAVLDMIEEAKKDGVSLRLNSGFRPAFYPNIDGKSESGVSVSAQSQEELYNQNCKNGKCSPATARAGTSKHGSGIAVDFNTGTRTGKLNSKLDPKIYSWLIKNSWRFGFLRTVSTEEWHYEYWPTKATKGPYASLPKSNNLFYSDLGLNNLSIV